MSVSTTCRVYWVSLSSQVSEVNRVQATCDSSLKTCILDDNSVDGFPATCDSTLQYPGSTNPTYSSFFCSCGSNTLQVPLGVDCASKCYDLSTTFTSCNYLTLYFGFTSGSSSSGVLEDTCNSFKCDGNGVRCTDSYDLLYTCDNLEHDEPTLSSTHSYVCNCAGPADVPDTYQNADTTQGTACGGATAAGTGRTTSRTAIGTATSAATIIGTSTARTTARTTTNAGSATTSAGTASGGASRAGSIASRSWASMLCASLLLYHLVL